MHPAAASRQRYAAASVLATSNVLCVGLTCSDLPPLQVVQALRSLSVPFQSVDILEVTFVSRTAEAALYFG